MIRFFLILLLSIGLNPLSYGFTWIYRDTPVVNIRINAEGASDGEYLVVIKDVPGPINDSWTMGTTGTVTVKVLGGVPDITLKTAGFTPYGGSSTSSGTWGLERISYKAPGQNWVGKDFEKSLTYSCVPYPDISYVGVKKYYDLTVNLRAVNGPDPEGEVAFDYQVINDDTLPLQIRLLVDGEVKGQFTVGPDQSADSSISVSLPTGQAGNYKWEFFTGHAWATLDEGSYRVISPEVPGLDPEKLFLHKMKTDPGPTPSPTPSPTPEPGGGMTPPRPKPTPPSSGTTGGQRDIIKGGGGGSNGELQKEDIYDAVKAALEDASEGKEALPENDLELDEFKKEAIEAVEGELADLKVSLEDVAGSVSGMIDNTLGQFEGVQQSVGSMPTSFGSKDRIHLGTFPVVGACTVDFSMLPLAIIREVMLWILRIFFIYAVCKLWVG